VRDRSFTRCAQVYTRRLWGQPLARISLPLLAFSQRSLRTHARKHLSPKRASLCEYPHTPTGFTVQHAARRPPPTHIQTTHLIASFQRDWELFGRVSLLHRRLAVVLLPSSNRFYRSLAADTITRRHATLTQLEQAFTSSTGKLFPELTASFTRFLRHGLVLLLRPAASKLRRRCINNQATTPTRKNHFDVAHIRHPHIFGRVHIANQLWLTVAPTTPETALLHDKNSHHA
jgi:hypothetical protein